MKAYELLAHLKHLQLAGQEEDGELMWLGNDTQWKAMSKEVEDYENPDWKTHFDALKIR